MLDNKDLMHGMCPLAGTSIKWLLVEMNEKQKHKECRLTS